MAHDIRHAVRMILKAPVTSLAIVLSLAAGIGVNTVVFSWIQTRILRPLPGVASGSSFVLIEPLTSAGMYPGMSWPEYRDLRERVRSFESTLAFRTAPMYVGETGRVQRVFGLLVSDDYFATLGVRPALGRFFREDEIAGTADVPVAVISYGLWQARFGGSASVVGQILRVNGGHVTVVGVTPRDFQGTSFGLDFDLWAPAALAPGLPRGSRELEDRRVRAYTAMGKLRKGVTRAQAQAEVAAVMEQLAREYPETNASVLAEVLPLHSSPRGPQRFLTIALVMLQGMMLLLLLAVCGNTANLALARASARRREAAVRLALGASRRRIAALLLTENVVLALCGAALAVPVAIWGTQAFQLLPLSGLPIRFQTRIDTTGMLFAMGLGVMAGAIFGAVPAAQLARVRGTSLFHAGSNAGTRSRLRGALMAIQVAFALVVLIAAGVFFRSLMETRDTDPGFARQGVLLAAYDGAGRGAARDFTRRLLDALRALPAVEGAAIASSVPLDIHGLPSRGFSVDGYTRVGPGADQALANTVTPGYLAVMKIPLVAGSDFAHLADVVSPPQVIVNEAFVRRYLEGLEPLGRRLQSRGRAFTIVGVARDSLYNAFGEPPMPHIYFSYRDNPLTLGEIHLRARAPEQTLAADVRAVMNRLDPEVPVFNVRTLDDHVETNLVFRRVPARMFAILGPLLLALAAMGIYAVVAHTVSTRTAEIAIRLAVGASPPRVIAEIVRDSMSAILSGALAGWLLAVLVAMHARRGTMSFPVFAAVPAVLLLVAVVACWLPARHVTRIDPAKALREGQ